MLVALTINKTKCEIELADTTTFEELQSIITERSDIEPSQQKIFLRGKRLEKVLSANDVLCEHQLFLAAAKSTGPIKLKVVGTKLKAVQQTQAAVADAQQRAAEQQQSSRPPRRWKLVPTLSGVSSASLPYGFRKIEPLPGLPDLERATKILHKLASDPGVVAVMKLHKISIECLTELYPKGQVGRSASCLMGLNVNKGEKICLRIRTDDLRGFRKYLSIREVLFHELTHQFHGEHDAKFWAFMSQLQRDADRLDWTKSAGKKVGGGQTLEYQQHKLRQRLRDEAAAGGHDEDKYGVNTFKLVPDTSFDAAHTFEGGQMVVGGDDLLGADAAMLSPRSKKRQQALLGIAIQKSRAEMDRNGHEKPRQGSHEQQRQPSSGRNPHRSTRPN